jgi:predicted secreted protein
MEEMKMNFKKIIALGLTGMILLSTTAFADDKVGTTSQVPGATTKPAVNITEKSNTVAVNPLKVGKINTIKVGQKFSVVLEENASTGYTWSYITNDKAIKLVSAVNKNISNDKNIVGAPTNKIWTFKALKKGTYKIKFSYARSWEKKTPAAKTAEYTVKIK